jgi:hypothetical protein
MPTVNRAKKSIADPNAFAVMMTLEAQVEEGIKTLSCFHLQSAEARELADCPGSS